jgi:potassium-dependent mechanosensitive channel
MVRRAAETLQPAVRAACSIAAALLLFLAASAFAQDGPIKAAADRLEHIRTDLDRIEAATGQADLRPAVLQRFRQEADPLRTELREIVATLEPIHAQTEARLKELGEPPTAEQPPEPLAVASEREQQSATLRDADAALRQARLLAVRAGQIVENIDRQRRAAFTDRLFERSQSVFVPALWLNAAAAVPAELSGLRSLVTHWYEHAVNRVGLGFFLLALLLSIAAIVVILMLRAAVQKRIGRPVAADGEIPLLPQSHKAVLAARDAFLDAITIPAASIAVLEIFSAFDLLPGGLRPLAATLVTAIILFSVSRALTSAVLSPHDSYRRLVTLDDAAARSIFRLIVSAAAVSSILLFVNELHRSLTTSVSLTVATSALYAFLIALIIAATLIANRASSDSEAAGMPAWARLSGWLVVTVIFVALAAGYSRLASLVAERAVSAAIVLIALTLLLNLVDALLGRGLKEDSPRRRSIAATFGLRVKALDLFAALLAGLLRALLVLAAIFLVIGTLTASTFDISSVLDPSALSIQLGETRIRFADIFGAFFILLIGIAVTRVLYGWLSRDILPRTELETSLQNSIATIAGYVGVIVAISLALGRLGVNLENIALVAGALSIGIGFGLQAIVSNFVSGLILLTERPIRVGDWIVVGNEQGYVRKISVRSTEIETFERASVIVPNSDLITGTVKNWTHFNNLGRISVPVGISYSSDPQAVRELLLDIANNHPKILRSPGPSVFFLEFGDSALQFELRGFVADVNQAFGVRSELHFEIFRRFREAGVEIPFPQRDIHIKSAPDAGSGGPSPDDR